MSTLVSWLSITALLVGVISCIVYFFRYRGCETWPTVHGTVEALVRIRSLGGDASSPFYGTLSYSYVVDGQYYSGEWNTPQFPSEQQVREFVDKFMAPKSAVVVQHNPQRPERSTLKVDPQLGQAEYLTDLKI
jgi:hypothetical protein